jgi:hypothetical protein
VINVSASRDFGYADYFEESFASKASEGGRRG